MKDVFQVACSLEYPDSLGKIKTLEQSKKLPVRIRKRAAGTPSQLLESSKPQSDLFESILPAATTDPLREELWRLQKENE